MSKQSSTIVTIAVALLTLCCSAAICSVGGLILAGGADWADDLGISYQGDMEPVYGVPVLCLGVLIWIVPALVGFFLTRRSREA